MKFTLPKYHVQLRWHEYHYGFYTVAGVNRKHAESRARRMLGIKGSNSFGIPGTMELVREDWRRKGDDDNQVHRGKQAIEGLHGHGKIAEGEFRIVGEITQRQITSAWKQTRRACVLRDRKTLAARR